MVSVRMFSNSSRSRSSKMLPVESISAWRDRIKSLLNKDRALLTPEDSQKVSSHFRNKVKRKD